MCEETNSNTENIDINELDILGRDEFVDNCKLLIDAIFDTTKSAFIMIDGEWGVGKTFVMNMLDKDLKGKYTVIKYNCWENSYYNDPLEAILSIMVDYIERDKLWTDEDKEKIKFLFNSIVFMLSLGTFKVKSKYRDNFNELKQGIKDNILLNKSINIHTAINDVKYFLGSNNEKIVILVDEIDRCLPEYSIKTLERLYLLFKNMPNIVVVIANDKNKLEQIIKNVFGYNSIDSYLEKFIDYVVKLKVDSCRTDRLLLKYKSYFDSFIIDDCCEKFIESIFAYNNVRYIDKVINKASKIHFLIFGKNTIYDSYVLMLELIFTIVGKNINFNFNYFINNLYSSKKKSEKAILTFFFDNVIIKSYSNQKAVQFGVDYNELYNKNINLYKILMWFDLCDEDYFENTETGDIGIRNFQTGFSIDFMSNPLNTDILGFDILKDIDINQKKEYSYLKKYLYRYIGNVDDFKKFVNESNLLLKYQLFIINLE